MRADPPTGWRRAQFGELVEQSADLRPEGPEPIVLSCSKDRGLVPQLGLFGKRLASADTRRYKRVRPGEFVYDPNLLWSGAVARSHLDHEGIVSPVYEVFRVRGDVDARFVEVWLRSPGRIADYRRISDGTNMRRRRAAFTELGQLPIDIPPRAEQRAIAAILDCIDEAIEQSDNVIAATEVLRRALLHELLTRGVPGRHTEWLQVPGIGTVPACWHVAPLGDLLVDIEAGSAPQRLNRPAVNDEWGVLRVGAVTWGEYRPAENKALAPGIEPERNLEVHSGDLLLSRANTPALVGRTVLVRSTPRRRLLSDKTLRLVPDARRTDHAFLHVVLGTAAARDQLSAAASGTSRSMFNISQASIRKVLLPVPPRDEQQLIVQLGEILQDAVSSQAAALTQFHVTEIALSEALLTGRTRFAASVPGAGLV